ncbi:MAG: C40 family peptidase [Galactobacter sp.]
MTKRVEAARHRAASTGTLELLSKAVAGNAGSMSRQAAVIAAAGGLVVTMGASGSAAASKTEAAPKADAKAASLDIQRVAKTEIHAAAVKGAPQTASLVKVVAKPAVERELAQTTVTRSQPAPVAAAQDEGSDTTASAPVQRPKLQSRTEQASASSANASTPSEGSDEGKSKTAAPKPTTESTATGSGLAATAKNGLGVPYRLGGNTTAGWDCSGFVRWVYAQNGKNISARTAAGIWKGGQFKATNNPKPGDIIIQRGGGHIAIYMGGGKYIGAQNPSAGTTWRDLGTSTDSFNGYYTWVG